MKKISIAGLVLVLMSYSILRAAEEPKMPEPQKEHGWLKQLVGEWDVEFEATMEPGKPPMKCKGTDSVRAIGGFWVLGEIKGTFFEMPMNGLLTLGYDPQKKKYVGTWIDSMNNYLWTYEGTLDESGKVLTLDTSGPCPMAEGKIMKFKEVMEIKDKDHRTFSSSVQGEDGKWMTMMTANYRRKAEKSNRL